MDSEVLYNQIAETSNVEQTLDFRDGSAQWGTAFAEGYDTSRDNTYHEDVPLSDFFSRPIKLATYTWSTSDVTPFYQDIDPWTLYFTNKRVANRISNYQNVSANLHVKFVINGNSFYYGRVMAEYFPLKNYDNISDVTGLSLLPVVQASQRLHAFIDPCESQGCELYLPFIWFYDKMNMTNGDFGNMGHVYLRGLNVLKHANGATGSLTIAMFVWASNVKMSIPTVQDISGIVPQAGKLDEYGGGIVSNMATAVANASGRLAKVPYIGKYARATELVSGAMGEVARMFGFSRPALIADYTDVRPTYIGRMAVTSGSDSVAKLTVDPKQELTIDPAVVGLGGADELAIRAIATRETYYSVYNWTIANVPGDVLLSARVGPSWRYTASQLYMTACMYAAAPFKYWRGSMKYRFQIVASGYHKGRLLVVWDPAAQNALPETNIQYSKIIDLAQDRDVTFEVGWGSPKTWLLVPAPGTIAGNIQTAAYTSTVDTIWNGVLTVYVLNELTSSNSAVNNDIQFNLFVSACDDFEVAVPSTDLIYNYTTAPQIVPQAGAFEEVLEDGKNAPHSEVTMGTFSMCNEPANDSASVYFGERITSFRQMLKRYDLNNTVYLPGLTTFPSETTVSYSNFPQPRGYSLYGLVTNLAAKNYNAANTGIMNYLGFAFMAYRGAQRRKYVFSSGNGATNSTMTITRSNTDGTSAQSVTTSAITNTSSSAFSVSKALLNRGAFAGTQATVTSQQPVLEVEIPYYNNARFVSTRNVGTGTTFDACVPQHLLKIDMPINGVGWVDSYVAAGEDTTFVGFQGCPPISYLTLTA